MKLIIGMILFEEVTILDFVGPYEVFTKIKDWEIKIIGLGGKKITCNGSLKIEAEYDISEIESVDILFVPGGYGVNEVILNPDFLKELERLGSSANYVTSVCTGSLALGAAGLLQGYQATSHWRSLDLLSYFGATPNPDRVVWDGNRITGGGITSGIDFALDLVKIIEGEERAKEIELWLEYDPKPPLLTGHPRIAPKEVLERVVKNTESSRFVRENVIREFLKNKQDK
ncbi:DJ-1/PfpI family protein [Leptospira ilyithenensis]|uniref:DJ-1/PfpI family protein n=1 Tax=Leptospira ilyithenensis TaxID=2484901 RepID=A0A4R9LRE0_9LEPT|nr:DJ-1/PfpI family protein [Leptospira ilyithenensis]TGN13188.1 DJ-1/PfpI family protein [Leptospira ilyithenensis]